MFTWYLWYYCVYEGKTHGGSHFNALYPAQNRGGGQVADDGRGDEDRHLCFEQGIKR